MLKFVFVLFQLISTLEAFTQVAVRQQKIVSVLNRFEEQDRVDTIQVLYPLITASNKTLSAKINQKIKRFIFDDIDSIGKLSLRQLVNRYAKEGLESLAYEIVFQNQYFLSIQFYISWVGAYPVEFSKYINFDLRTGNMLDLESLLKRDQQSFFKEKLRRQKNELLNQYIVEANEMVRNKELAHEDFDWVMDEIKNCKSELDLKQFSLTGQYLQIFDQCPFPNAIKNMTPTYELKYKLSDLNEFLKEDVLKRLR